MTGVLTAVALALALLCGAGAAQAQVPAPTVIKLVGNTGQADSGTASFDNDHAQEFITGASSRGYKLTRVDLEMTQSGTAPTYTVSIHQDAPGSPGTKLGTLENPTSLPTTTGLVQFTHADGIDLAPSTPYWVVIDVTGGASDDTTAQKTSASAEDTGRAAGWSIKDRHFWRVAGTSPWTIETANHLQLAVHGYAKPTSLVSNTGQPNASSSLLTFDYAQAFTTGAASSTLTRVDIQFTRSTSAPTYTVAIHSDASGSPGTSLTDGTLTNPASLSAGLNQFTPSGAGIDLAASTTYWVVVDVASGGNATQLTTTASDSESGTTGWSIADGNRSRNLDNTGSWNTSANSLKIAVHGSEKITCSAADTAVSWASSTPADLAKLANDCTTLLNLKDTLRGADHPTSPGRLDWAKDTRMDAWDGLTGTNSITGTPPRVSRLELSAKSLTGSIPPALGDLAGLTWLELSYNQLSGPIPKELGKLENLTDPILQNNQLTGPIPMELGDLENLTGLYLQNNQLTGPIPEKLGDLENLTMLVLQNNRLTGPIPAGTDSMNNPTGLAKLTGLTTLALDRNYLSGPIPKELGKLTNLTILVLDRNHLSGPIPASLNELTNLVEISFHTNQLTGPVPDLSETNLSSLDLANNRLTSVDLDGLSSLTRLYLENNRLTSVANLPGILTTIILSHNRLTNVPTLPSSLTRLDLSHNQLPSVADLPSSLTRLDLSHNQLMSIDVSSLTSLTRLDLSHNQLMSIDVSSLTSLGWLNLQHNQLTTAPNVGSLTALTRFWLYGNKDLDPGGPGSTPDRGPLRVAADHGARGCGHTGYRGGDGHTVGSGDERGHPPCGSVVPGTAGAGPDYINPTATGSVDHHHSRLHPDHI